MQSVIEAHLRWLAATNRAPATIRNRRAALARLRRWCEAAGCLQPAHLTLAMLETYRLTLCEFRTASSTPLAWGTQAEYLGAVRAFLAWCFARGIVAHNAAQALELPKRPYQLPLSVLSIAEMGRVLRLPRRSSPQGLRDRAILELLYSTGLRRVEVAQLAVADVDQDRRVVLVRSGKGRRDRVVPLGRRAMRWVQRYLRRARPLLVCPTSGAVLFLTTRGRPMRLNRLSERVHGYLTAAGLGNRGSCHIFRHTMATHLLDGGADVRDVQEILGHANLSTTARYTHVSIVRLQQVHARAHPAERGYLRKGP